MTTLKRPDKTNPFVVEVHPDMISATTDDLKIGNTIYFFVGESIHHNTVVEHKVRDRVLAEKNKGGFSNGIDETLEEYREYKRFLTGKLNKGLILKMK